MAVAADKGHTPDEYWYAEDNAGSFYLYHGRLEFAVQMAEVGDQIIAVIPTASSVQWDALFGAPPALTTPLPPDLPDTVPRARPPQTAVQS